MRIAICDDEKNVQLQLAQTLQAWPHFIDSQIDYFSSGLELLEKIKMTTYDFILLDIEMPDVDGLEVAHSLRRDGYDCLIAFCTSHAELALEGYEVSAVRFLKKPLEAAKLYECLDYVYEKVETTAKIAVTTAAGETFLKIQDILYIEAQNKTIQIFLKDHHQLLAKEKFSALVAQLAPHGFFRCHRSYLIALKQIVRLDFPIVYLTEEHAIPVSRSLYKSLKEHVLHVILGQS